MSTWDWNVRELVAKQLDETGAEVENPTVEAIYDKINLMCFLLKDTDYNTLYNLSLAESVEGLITFSGEAPDRLLTNGEKTSIADCGRELIELIEHEPSLRSLKFRNLYESDGDVPDSVYTVYAKMNAAVPSLCFPFLDLKKGGTLVNSAEIDGVLAGLGEVTHHQLFTTPKNANGVTDNFLDAVSTAKELQLMANKRNEHECVNNKCRPLNGETCYESFPGGPCNVIS